MGMMQNLTWLRDQTDALSGLVNGLVGVVRQLRGAGGVLFAPRQPDRPALSYETLWLNLVLDLQDIEGERAVLTRQQRVQFLTSDATVVRELVWGAGEQLARYTASGARRVGLRVEGSKRAVLLDPERRYRRGERLTISSRRTIAHGFLDPEGYCEALLERPTGRLALSVLFPQARPPRTAQLVSAATEQQLRTVPVRYGQDGRARLQCRLHKPAVATTYSLRWTW